LITLVNKTDYIRKCRTPLAPVDSLAGTSISGRM
jgi:hypothetical protein